jgi:hypothetical protein
MVSSVTQPSSSAVRVVIDGITMWFLIAAPPTRAGVRRMVRGIVARKGRGGAAAGIGG